MSATNKKFVKLHTLPTAQDFQPITDDGIWYKGSYTTSATVYGAILDNGIYIPDLSVIFANIGNVNATFVLELVDGRHKISWIELGGLFAGTNSSDTHILIQRFID